MKPRLLTLFSHTTLAVLISLAVFPAQAIGHLADVTVVDRDTGVTLPWHHANGEYWVAGRPGARYAVNVRNRTGERVLAVPPVDGVNVLSGETAGWGQGGYVFSAYEQYQISGWRKSSSEIAAFEFSNASNAYASRTGRPANVGVIGVALFREQRALPVPQRQVYPKPPRRGIAPPDDRSAKMRESDDGLREGPPAAAAASEMNAPAASRTPQAELRDQLDSSAGLAKTAPAHN